MSTTIRPQRDQRFASRVRGIGEWRNRLGDVTRQLAHEGIARFAASRASVLAVIAAKRAALLATVGVDLLHVPDLTESPPQILYDLHAFERRAQAIGGDVHCIHDASTRSVGRDSRPFVGDTRRLGGFPRFLCQLPPAFRFISGGLD